ncbi:MAG: helix-turn-helix domain-containing protein [Candidatus Brocadiaceae bacterium]|nr:helix-turn-helix domain-containing protein [Candidatus Brocadiaceae bacterium]
MDILTIQDAAELLVVDPKTIYRLAERGELPAFKVGRQWRMRKRDLDAWIEEQLRINEAPAAYAGNQQLLFNVQSVSTGQIPAKKGFSDSAFSENSDLPVHRWVPWIAGFSAVFVAEALDHYLNAIPAANATVLDPFAGVGTTPVTALLQGHPVWGFEINPYAATAARLKLGVHGIPVEALQSTVARFETEVTEAIGSGREPTSRPPAGFVSRQAFFSPPVEQKVLLVRDFINGIVDPSVQECFRVALASELVGFSNYSYEPSLGTRAAAGKSDVLDAPVVQVLVRKLRQMLSDIRDVQARVGSAERPKVEFHRGSFFDLHGRVPGGSIDLVLTSPPYLNNYHYVRNSRPQMYWLDLVGSPGDLKQVEQNSFGKFWQNVRAQEAVSLEFPLPDLEADLAMLRTINTHKGQYGGAGWANYAATYFNDCHRFAGILARILRPGGRAVIVLGNSILQGVEFRTDDLFARICELQGLKAEETIPLREKRTGSSIIKSSVRANAAKARTSLYECAVVLARPA